MTDYRGSDFPDRNDGPGSGRPPGPAPGSPRDRTTGGPTRVIDAGRLWAGGVMAGVVAGGVAVVGLLITRGILDIPVLVSRDGDLVPPSTWWYAGTAFLAALFATGLMHILLIAAPQPYRFFAWIFGLVVTIAALVPLTTGAALDTRVSVCVINLAIGLTIGSIASGVSRSAAQVLDEP